MSKCSGDDWECLSSKSEFLTGEEDDFAIAYPPATMKLLKELAWQIDIEARRQVIGVASFTETSNAKTSLDEAFKYDVRKSTDFYPSLNG